MSKKVFVGMSGGVDSSVTAMILKDAGYEVTGVYMKNWAEDIPGFNCPWEEDLVDADAVAAQLGIKLKVFDFEKQYKDKVVKYMLDGYTSGITPNPDIMCNQEIKFKLFLETAIEEGADLIATGHYAKLDGGQLKKAIDQTKDQTYFLYRVDRDAFRKVLFPLGEFTKKQVRQKAESAGLVTAKKKDSVGLCFVGDVDVRDFLKEFVDYESGPIIDQHGKEIGKHEGAIFYTIGQRHGLGVGGGLPYYVVDKDMQTNTVFVTTDLDDEKLWSDRLAIVQPHWVDEPPEIGMDYQIRVRYGAKLINGKVTELEKDRATIKLEELVKAAAPGQSAVVYSDDLVLGGGVIT